MKLTCLAITCGGTGGHFYPGLSIARVFQRQDGEVLLLLSGVNSEKQREIAESYGVPAAVLVDNTDFTARRATELFRDFLDAPEGWRHRAERARALAKPHAAETMLAAISDYFDSTR